MEKEKQQTNYSSEPLPDNILLQQYEESLKTFRKSTELTFFIAGKIKSS